jgi:hypothetical protein
VVAWAWYTDSLHVTIDMWNNLEYKCARKWPSVDNKDVWIAPRGLKRERGGDRVEMIKAPAHQDR